MNKRTDYKLLLEDRENRSVAERLVLKSGVRPDLEGFDFLACGVILFANGVGGFNDIYRKLAEIYDVDERTIMRQIGYALRNSADIPNRLSALTGKMYDCPIQNSDLIAEIAALYKAPAK